MHYRDMKMSGAAGFELIEESLLEVLSKARHFLPSTDMRWIEEGVGHGKYGLASETLHIAVKPFEPPEPQLFLFRQAGRAMGYDEDIDRLRKG